MKNLTKFFYQLLQNQTKLQIDQKTLIKTYWAGGLARYDSALTQRESVVQIRPGPLVVIILYKM